MTGTHTYVVLEVSPPAYREIRESLETAGYEHAFHQITHEVARDGEVEGELTYELLDMHGLALVEARRACPPIAGHVFVGCALPHGCERKDRCHWTDPHLAQACGALAEEHVA